MRSEATSKIEIGFTWERDTAGHDLRSSPDGLCITQKGTKETRAKTTPLRDFPSLFLLFASLKKTPESFRNFADKFGLLGIIDTETAIEIGGGGEAELVEHWKYEHKAMNKALDAWQAFTSAEPQQKREALRTFLNTFQRHRSAYSDLLVWKLIPHYRTLADPLIYKPALQIGLNGGLISALWLQFAVTVAADGRDLRRCDFCSNWFFRGGRGGRAHARFCSTKCSNDFHNASKARKREASI